MWRPYQFLGLVLFFQVFQASLSLSASSATQLCSRDEAAALIQFKDSFSINKFSSSDCDDAGNKSYPKTNSWKEGTDCCQWDGVTCDKEEGQVIGLDLSCSWLYGTIPSNSSLFLLPHLQKLNLAFNYFNSSKMSSEFGRFASLVYLNLSHTGFSGKVPSQLSHLSKLVSLDLSSNFLPPQVTEEHTLEGLVHNLTQVFQAGLSLSSSSATQLCSCDEAAALIQFKDSFSIDEFSSWYCDDAGIKSNPKTNSWKEGTDCCQWDGVTCDKEEGQVIGLALSCSWLYGTIPSNSSLFLLPHLQKLNLAFNDFNFSKMSSEFGRFASLRSLNLSHTSFSGKVPSQLSHLSKLVSLDLSFNSFVIEEHTLEGLVHNLTQVRKLFFDGINMSSINPNVLMNLSSSLRSLGLSECELRGKFPKNIFDLPNLKWINLGGNSMLSLHLPKFNRSSKLELLDLSQMSFSTELIDSIGNLHCLKYLYLCEISFSRRLPNSITNLSSLEHLDAPYTDFYGGILPSSIGNLVSLKHLSLRFCNLSGSIPRSLGNLSQLNYLDLSANSFSGQIPSEVTAFPNLISLHLTDNLFNGTLPSWLYAASSLKYINLAYNQIHGHIKEFHPKSLLEVIRLRHNKLQGSLPSSILNLVNLTHLSLSSNNLSGPLQFSMLSNLQHLQYLDVSRNSPSFNCNGTSADFTLPDLRFLFLSSCNINEFPQFLKGSKDLESLDLSNNKIHGEIPKWMWEVGKDSLSFLNLSHNFLTKVEKLPWKEIQIVDLTFNMIHGDLPVPSSTIIIFLISNNNLSGEISSQICNVDIQVLGLSRNNLSGEISSQICNASTLKVLDLSHNNLSGIIPQCFGSLVKSAWTLNLQMNKFSGSIPPTFPKGCELKNLNINGNQLEGPLTRSIINCTNLEVLDFGNNSINDTFPHWLGSLPQLKVLVLHSSQLYGRIWDNRSNPFPKIQIFDISNNYFTGLLPVRYIKNFKTMTNIRGKGSELSYMGTEVSSDANNAFYSYSIQIAYKGEEIELVKIFTMLTSIDLSSNKFKGEIPKVIGKLNSLKGLNLSHNNLSGCIPTSIGNLASLEWLDLSSNKLVGMIPETLLSLTFLSFFNVSKNQLGGQIPQGKQFATFGNDSYEGNRGLCGFPVSKGCSNSSNESQSPHLPTFNSLEMANFDFGWKVVLIGYGCGVMFGLVVGYVVFRTGKPIWLVSLVENQCPKRRRK